VDDPWLNNFSPTNRLYFFERVQFGPGEIQQHGFARNVNWSVKSMTDTSVELEMAPSDYTKAIWDKEFLCTFSVDLQADQLSTKMLVENKGEESFDFQAALHSYFTVSAIDNLEIAGSFEGKEFLNKMVNGGEMQTEDRSVITIAEEYDRVYKGVNDPVLKDKGTGKTVSEKLIFDCWNWQLSTLTCVYLSCLVMVVVVGS
jgi:glucose-6-phosphate 1-epimerase